MHLNVFIDHRLLIRPAEYVPQSVLNQLKRELTFANPIYEERLRRGHSVRHLQRWITGYEIDGQDIYLPRGYTPRLLSILKNQRLHRVVHDRRWHGPVLTTPFQGTLRTFQEEALKAVLRQDFGVVEAPTGSGKTVLAIATIAARHQATLVVVHTRELVFQWRERLEEFMPGLQVGLWTGGLQRRTRGLVTVGTVNSILKDPEILKYFGFLIVDECHRTPARTFMEVVQRFGGRYMLGLSATPYRRDGMTPLIYWSLGPMVYQVGSSTLEQEGIIVPHEVVWRLTETVTDINPQTRYSHAISALVQDKQRNALIVTDIVNVLKQETDHVRLLVLTERREHCLALASQLQNLDIQAAALTGQHGITVRQEVIRSLIQGELRVLVATSQLIGEGFDCRSLSHIFLTTPIKSVGRLRQYMGRVLRAAPNKRRAIVYDYVDPHPVFVAAAKARAKVYKTVLPAELINKIEQWHYKNSTTIV